MMFPGQCLKLAGTPESLFYVAAEGNHAVMGKQAAITLLQSKNRDL